LCLIDLVGPQLVAGRRVAEGRIAVARIVVVDNTAVVEPEG